MPSGPICSVLFLFVNVYKFFILLNYNYKSENVHYLLTSLRIYYFRVCTKFHVNGLFCVSARILPIARLDTSYFLYPKLSMLFLRLNSSVRQRWIWQTYQRGRYKLQSRFPSRSDSHRAGKQTEWDDSFSIGERSVYRRNSQKHRRNWIWPEW